MLHADFENVLKGVEERYRDNMNTMKTERKGKVPDTEMINTHQDGVYTAPLLMEISLTP